MRTRSFVIRAMLAVFATGSLTSLVQAQFFFQADAVFLGRNHEDNATFITGPEAVSAGAGNYGFEPGYRLQLGTVLEDFQIDGSFLQINPWTASSRGTFANPVVFDDTANNGFVVAAPPGNTLSFPGVLRTASLSSLAAANESTEGELLRAGSVFSTLSTSNYNDFELNIGTSQYRRRWRMAVGYRQITLSEKNRLQLAGVFDAIDVNDGAVFGQAGNDPNDGLSNEALVNAGATAISGAADGFDSFNSPNGVDNIAYQIDSQAANNLNGAQAIFAYRFLDGAWLTVDGIAKAGVFRNRMGGQVRETIAGSGNDDSVYQRILTDRSITAAFAGNLGLQATACVTDYIDVVVGYQVIFISGVGLGANQLNGVTTNAAGATVYQAQTNGALIAHGGTIGLLLYW